MKTIIKYIKLIFCFILYLLVLIPTLIVFIVADIKDDNKTIKEIDNNYNYDY